MHTLHTRKSEKGGGGGDFVTIIVLTIHKLLSLFLSLALSLSLALCSFISICSFIAILFLPLLFSYPFSCLIEMEVGVGVWEFCLELRT